MTINLPDTAHPVKDIVLPIAVVVALVGNALFVGIVVGKFTYRFDYLENRYESHHEEEKQRNASQDQSIQSLKDRVHDIERDNKEEERRFYLLDDYTRGRIDRLPYKAPPPARW